MKGENPSKPIYLKQKKKITAIPTHQSYFSQ